MIIITPAVYNQRRRNWSVSNCYRYDCNEEFHNVCNSRLYFVSIVIVVAKCAGAPSNCSACCRRHTPVRPLGKVPNGAKSGTFNARHALTKSRQVHFGPRPAFLGWSRGSTLPLANAHCFAEQLFNFRLPPSNSRQRASSAPQKHHRHLPATGQQATTCPGETKALLDPTTSRWESADSAANLTSPTPKMTAIPTVAIAT